LRPDPIIWTTVEGTYTLGLVWRGAKTMKRKSPTAWAIVFAALSTACALLAVVSVPVAATGAPLIVSAFGLLFAVVAAVFAERASHGQFTTLGTLLAVVVAVAVAGVLIAILGLAWPRRPHEFWIRVITESQYRYVEWTTLGVWMVGSWAVLCSIVVASSGVIAARLCCLMRGANGRH
jgi:hypothetical protein